MEKTNGKPSTRAKNKYNAAKYDSLRIVVPKGRKANIEAYATATNQTINGLVNSFLRNALGMSEDEWKKSDDTGEA